jgi:hypothetical protein
MEIKKTLVLLGFPSTPTILYDNNYKVCFELITEKGEEKRWRKEAALKITKASHGKSVLSSVN